MDIQFLTNISHLIETAIVLVSSMFLLMLAPGLTVDFLKKLIYLSVGIALWMVFVAAFGNDLKEWTIIVFSTVLYKILTEDTVIFIYQCFLFLVTAKMLFWFLGVGSRHHEAATPQHR